MLLISEIPQTLIDVTVAAEDKRFWEHHGVDWLRTIRSTLGYFGGSSRIQGGSTITQQVIKNLTGNDEVTPERKVQGGRFPFRIPVEAFEPVHHQVHAVQVGYQQVQADVQAAGVAPEETPITSGDARGFRNTV